MKKDPITNTLKPFDLDQLLQEVPELQKFDINISTYVFAPLIDSSDMQPAVWVELAHLIQENYSKFDGFVVLHGTDTMAYSASALSFMLKNLNKPVIFTGSQIPIGEVRTDGKENIITSVEIAGSKQNGRAIVPEVAICFQNLLIRGNRATKYSSESLDAFKSFNYPPLADIGIDINYNYPCIKKSEDFCSPLKVSTDICSDIMVIEIFPGFSSELLRNILNIEGLKGVIIKSYGAGNAPSSSQYIKEIQSAIDKGIIVLNVSQCKSGKIDMNLYATGKLLSNIGVISGYDMTLEAAVCKLMYLLGRDFNREETIMFLTNSMRGELTR